LGRRFVKSLSALFSNQVGFQIGSLSLANQGFGFWQKFCLFKSGIFSGGSFPSLGFSKISARLFSA
jgi:hypothetical protein